MKKDLLYPIFSLLLLVLVWEFSTVAGGVPSYIFPSFHLVVQTFVQQFWVLCTHGAATLLEAGIGLLLASLLAFGLAILMDCLPLFKKSVYPLLVVTQTIPVIVLTPIFLIYFGFGMTPKILTVILMCFFPIAISFTDALDKTDPDMLALFRLYQANQLQIYRYIKIPSALSSFFSGMRVAATYCVSGAVVGEWISSDKGLGYYMLRVKNSGALDKVFACVLFIILLSLGMNGIVHLLQKICTVPKRRKTCPNPPSAS